MGPQQVSGSIEPPPSKAYTHRALIAGLLAKGSTLIKKPLSCDDTERTIEGIKALGAIVSRSSDSIIVESSGPPHELKQARLNCGESGATLRFLAAACSSFPRETTLTPDRSLSSRPLLPLLHALQSLGAHTDLLQRDDNLTIKVEGPLQGGRVSIPGNISSQFISGLLLAAPYASRDVEIQVSTRLESRPYVDLTLEIMRTHRVRVETLENGFLVPAPQTYSTANHIVPTDFSSAAFSLVAGITMGDGLSLRGVRDSPIEPDSAIIPTLEEIGVKFRRNEDRLDVFKSHLDAFKLDLYDHPDLVPALEVLACHAKGKSEIRGVERLVHKESNRLRSFPEELEKLGAKITVADDKIVIDGECSLHGGDLLSHHDHRVAMACATASLGASGTTTISEAEVVSKSYPGFYGDLEMMGVVLVAE